MVMDCQFSIACPPDQELLTTARSSIRTSMRYRVERSVLDELGLDRQAALELKLKAALHQKILQLVRRRGYRTRGLAPFPLAADATTGAEALNDLNVYTRR